MPPKKKQPPRNGYYFLMLEHKRREEERGRYITLKMAADEVKDEWAYMDAANKDYYNKMADKYKVEQSFEKYNTLGTPYSELEREQKAREVEKQFMDEMIKDTVQHLDRRTTLRRKEFFLIHINHYCETETRHFIPAEIAIAKFNLEDGVIDTFHTYVSPGELPMGYRYIATEHTNNTHKTPIDWERGETDLNKLFMSIKSFLKPDGTRGDLPPLYTMPDNANTNTSTSAVKGVLQELCINHGDQPELFRVFTLPKLFFELRNACNTSPVFPTQTIAESELEKDVFNYTRGIACKYHEDEDVMQFCSLSTVQRWVYLICDHCCKDLEIDIIPGSHCPQTADVHGGFKKVWRPRKESVKNNESEHRPRSPPASERHSKDKPITIIHQGELRQPHKSSLLRRHPYSSQDSSFTGFVEPDTEKSGPPPEKVSQPASCWSSVAERSSNSAPPPPTFDEDNYPSIGGGSGRGSANDVRYAAWSGRGRGLRE